MATVTPVPDLTIEMNKGFDVSDTAPIIHSIRWRHLPTRYIFSSVNDVITYHQKGPLVVDINQFSVAYLDVYFLKSASISQAKLYLRYVRASDGTLIEETLTTGAGGKALTLTYDQLNSALKTIQGVAFTQKDLGDGTPMYDFINMAGVGVYEVWVKAVTSDGKELHLLIPFQWADSITDPGSGTGGTVPTPTPTAITENYDGYYVHIIEGDSPFTKRPSTQFRQAAVAMLDTPYCFERISTPVQTPIQNVPSISVIGDEPVPVCALSISPTSTSGHIGDTVNFTLNHTNKSGILKIVPIFNNDMLEEVDEDSFKILKDGAFDITFTVTYKDGQECAVIGSVLGEIPENVLPCGQEANGASGYAEYTHQVSEDGIYYIDYNFYVAPDDMKVYVGSALIHETGSKTYQEGSPFGFHYKPSDGALKVVMNDGDDRSSKWTYTLYCPSNAPDEIKSRAIVVN